MKALLSRPATQPLWVFLLGGFLLLGAGAASTPEEEPPKPRTVTVTSLVTKEVEVEVTKEVPTTPAACAQAIGFAREGFDLASNFGAVVSAMFTAASELNTAEMERQSAKLEPINDDLTALVPLFNGTSAECEASE